MIGISTRSLSADRYKKSVGEEFVSSKIENGVIYYRPEYAFLSNAWRNADGVREDFLVSPPATLRKCLDYGDPYIEREYSHEGIKRGDFKKLSQLHRENYERLRFEEVMGIKLDENTDVGHLYHTYSGGIEVMGAGKAQQCLMDQFKTGLIEGMAELAKHGIDYSHPLPSNLRYDFDGKLICSPHDCIMIYNRELSIKEQINNLAILLYTHSWIEDTAQFLNEYFKNRLTEKEIRRVEHMIEENMKDTDEDNLLEVPYYWWPRWGGR